jgi:hypothetical protein
MIADTSPVNCPFFLPQFLSRHLTIHNWQSTPLVFAYGKESSHKRDE